MTLSEARAELARLVKASSRQAIGRRVGVSYVSVANWISGPFIPRRPQRAMLEDHYGIPATAWETTAPSPAKKGRRAAEAAPPEALAPTPVAPSAPPQPPVVQEAARAPRAPEQGPGTSIGVLEALVRDLAEDYQSARAPGKDNFATISDVAKLASALTSAQRQLSKARGETDITDAMVLRSAVWQRIVHMLPEALRPFPDALKAAIGALSALESG